ncbi:unnamed protein product [Prorocentrum cordatum]|uniref:Uncharacterized protein n=1 Tax=Prorocentrum cordatum TaxID=2364126 RepID=A0ABN9VAE8_9DINO|nr:unnamed protein product [Polarella glacialis]
MGPPEGAAVGPAVATSTCRATGAPGASDSEWSEAEAIDGGAGVVRALRTESRRLLRENAELRLNLDEALRELAALRREHESSRLRARGVYTALLGGGPVLAGQVGREAPACDLGETFHAE